jgi:hypothetical protein
VWIEFVTQRLFGKAYALELLISGVSIDVSAPYAYIFSRYIDDFSTAVARIKP